MKNHGRIWGEPVRLNLHGEEKTIEVVSRPPNRAPPAPPPPPKVPEVTAFKKLQLAADALVGNGIPRGDSMIRAMEINPDLAKAAAKESLVLRYKAELDEFIHAGETPIGAAEKVNARAVFAPLFL